MEENMESRVRKDAGETGHMEPGRAEPRRRGMIKYLAFAMIIGMCLVSCAGSGTEYEVKNKVKSEGKTSREVKALCDVKTPECAAEMAMEALRNLDFATFNALTDNCRVQEESWLESEENCLESEESRLKSEENCLKSENNWLGIPGGCLYQIFNELQQYGSSKDERFRKKYEQSHRIAEKIVEHLAWEINEVKEQDGQAEISMAVTNVDLSDVLGYYTIQVMENMVDHSGSGLTQMVQDFSDMYLDFNGIITYIEKAEEPRTVNVTVTAWKEDGRWRLHLSDEFISAVTGDFYNAEFSEEIQNRIDRLEKDYERKMERWGEDLEEMIESRVERIFEGW